jgi:hypothetical protein
MSSTDKNSIGKTSHKGGCHCGAVSFEVMAPQNIEILDCNCSICHKTGYQHLIVPAEDFKLLTAESHLSLYLFGTHTAKHMFCSHCGIKSHYIPRSHPDGYSVNFRCLNAEEFKSVKLTPFDGKNWEDSAAKLSAGEK